MIKAAPTVMVRQIVMNTPGATIHAQYEKNLKALSYRSPEVPRPIGNLRRLGGTTIYSSLQTTLLKRHGFD
jgi:hypothetical protein